MDSHANSNFLATRRNLYFPDLDSVSSLSKYYQRGKSIAFSKMVTLIALFRTLHFYLEIGVTVPQN